MATRSETVPPSARNRGIVPSSFFVDSIEKVGDRAIGGGGFADVWKGCFHVEVGELRVANFVALKILRTFKNATAAKALKQVSQIHLSVELFI